MVDSNGDAVFVPDVPAVHATRALCKRKAVTVAVYILPYHSKLAIRGEVCKDRRGSSISTVQPDGKQGK